MNGLLAQAGDDALDFGNGVREECLKATAEVIQARLTVRGAEEPVLRAFAPTVRKIGTLTAMLRQGFAFGVAKLDLGAGKHLSIEHRVVKVSQPILGKDIVVAGENTAVVFQRDPFAA